MCQVRSRFHSKYVFFVVCDWKLWNTTLKPDDLIDEFVSGYFGKAAPFIRTYGHRYTIQIATVFVSKKLSQDLDLII